MRWCRCAPRQVVQLYRIESTSERLCFAPPYFALLLLTSFSMHFYRDFTKSLRPCLKCVFVPPLSNPSHEHVVTCRPTVRHLAPRRRACGPAKSRAWSRDLLAPRRRACSCAFRNRGFAKGNFMHLGTRYSWSADPHYTVGP